MCNNDDILLTKVQKWLKTGMHAMTCRNKNCQERQCGLVKLLLLYIINKELFLKYYVLTAKMKNLAEGLRVALYHFVTCENPDCALCSAFSTASYKYSTLGAPLTYNPEAVCNAGDLITTSNPQLDNIFLNLHAEQLIHSLITKPDTKNFFQTPERSKFFKYGRKFWERILNPDDSKEEAATQETYELQIKIVSHWLICKRPTCQMCNFISQGIIFPKGDSSCPALSDTASSQPAPYASSA
mmetsp:Transcript_34701/g.62476  ORF Transcript_34701/g.62476 Transcript_34701/m.62476 type:complete len:241 (+) Transcript_34701:17-739(+)